MSIARIYLLASVIVGISFLAFGSVDSAYAANFNLNDQTSCEDPPLSGSWSGNTCTLSNSVIFPAADNLIVSNGVTLIVSNGVTLEISTNNNLINRGDITNDGIITIDGTKKENGRLHNQNNANFTNLGTITITGGSDDSGRLNNEGSTFTNSGTVTITGSAEQGGWLLNHGSSTFTNSGTITINGTSNNSGQFRNLGTASFTNLGKIILPDDAGDTGDVGLALNGFIFTNSGFFSTRDDFRNNNANSVITNSGTIQVTLNLNNNNGFIFNDCGGEIIFGSISGNPIEEVAELECIFGTSNQYEDPTIGKSHSGKQVVENGICIDIRCWTVTANYHQDFELVEMFSDSTHTITTTVFCQHGVNKCNYVAFGVSPYGTNINDSVWKIILQKDHLDNWTMKVIDPEGYLGEITSTTQKVNDNRYLSASVTIEFKKPTPGMILNIEVRDSGGGYRDFKFNDGISIADAYAYPSIETSYEQPLDVEPLCLNENSNKRYTCAFDKVRDWTIKNAEAALEQITK